MRRLVPVLLVALVVLAGCTSSTPESPTATLSPTASPEPTSVTYVVRAGDIPDAFASVEVTFRVVFVDHPDDLGPCYPDVFRGPYKPTLTPLPTPTGECHRSDPITVDLTAVDGTRSLGTFTASGSTRGHALVVTDLDVTLENGTRVSAIKGIGGAELVREPTRPSGSYGVRLGLRPAEPDADYDYYLSETRFDPGE